MVWFPLPLVWTNLSESCGLKEVFVVKAILSTKNKKIALPRKAVKRYPWLTWMSISKISRKYWVVRSVESLKNGLFAKNRSKMTIFQRLYRHNCYNVSAYICSYLSSFTSTRLTAWDGSGRPAKKQRAENDIENVSVCWTPHEWCPYHQAKSIQYQKWALKEKNMSSTTSTVPKTKNH